MSVATLPPLSQKDLELSWKYPAVESRGGLYLIQDNKIVGRAKVVSGRTYLNGVYEFASIELTDIAAREFFKDDYTILLLGQVFGLRYDGITGRPVPGLTDEPEDRHKSTEIVDDLAFDYGIAHPRFASVEGWASARNPRRPSIKEPQLKRRPRSSNKIKKVS